ncbi:glycoside hydrolase family protein [Flavicella sediminum]|uniref:hypothetical protein n=1 Tax=Flavicella sediminum TaxID=2585141 RepID=UPI00111DBA03|nr:hypothetical protein [Flavicella sediminum]
MKITYLKAFFVSCIVLGSNLAKAQVKENWAIDTQVQWEEALSNTQDIKIKNAKAVSGEGKSFFSSKLKSFKKKRNLKSIVFKQAADWNNWKEIPKVRTEEMLDAPVLISVKANDYYLLARRYDTHPERIHNTRKIHSDAELGYHAWHSTDMKNWKHYGPVSGYVQRWVTTAEYKNGKFYIYYDNPNDEDPHLIIDKDLMDGKMGKNIGMVFNDPTHGSDCAVLRDEDEMFHLIYENWDYNNARKHSWDAPVGGHAISKDGIHDFKIVPPAVDERTTSTGSYATFLHPYKAENYTTMKYEVYEPEQNAYGDWTAIKIGKQYYLFGDNDPAGGRIKVGKFTSDSMSKTFTYCGEFGMGHPDPTIAFAEGQFYLLQQQGKVDFVSPGPWVPGVEARVGVDTNNDGKINQWTDWNVVAESYQHKKGFARVVAVEEATIDVSKLPAAYGVRFEYRTKAVANKKELIQMKSILLSFE